MTETRHLHRRAPRRHSVAAAVVLVLVGAACQPPARVEPDAGLREEPPAVVPVFAPSRRTMAEILGLDYLPPRSTKPSAVATRTEDLERLPAVGVRTLRREFLWSEIEHQPGLLEFLSYDRVVDECVAAGLEIAPVLAYGAPWANASSGGDSRFPPDAPEDFAAYARATVLHFRGRIHTWEVWSEPNVGWLTWRPQEDPAAFGELLKTTSAAIREADPGAEIVLGGLAYHQETVSGALTFLDALYAAHPDVGAAFDVLGLHPYATYPPVAAPEEALPPEEPLPIMLARVRTLLDRVGDPKPIYVTEFGWPVHARIDEMRQAQYLVRGFFHLVAAGADRVLWHTLRDGPLHDSFPPDDAFGILRFDPQPTDGVPAESKPGWVALSTILSLAGGTRMTQDLRPELQLDDYSYAYRLESGGRRVTVFWRSLDAEPHGIVGLAPRKLDAGRTRLISMLGQELALIPAGEHQWRVGITPTPVYLIEQ